MERQIQIAKSLLESRGYIVSKIEESNEFPITREYRGYSLSINNKSGCIVYKGNTKIREFDTEEEALAYIDIAEDGDEEEDDEVSERVYHVFYQDEDKRFSHMDVVATSEIEAESIAIYRLQKRNRRKKFYVYKIMLADE